MATRLLDGLGPSEEVKSALKAVEESFDKVWLEQKKGKSIVQEVWQRSDRLASIEIVTLGQAILRLQKNGQDSWLKKIIKDIKKAQPPHGLIAEIIAYGLLSFGDYPMTPAKSNCPGYDFEFLNQSLNQKYYISVKNHDLTESARRFNNWCSQIREKWKIRLTKERKNLSLNIIFNKPIDDNSFNLIVKCIDNKQDLFSSYRRISNKDFAINITKLSYEDSQLSSQNTSESVLIVAPAPAREQERFIHNIKEAADKFEKHVKKQDENFRIIYMRVHRLADLNYLSSIVTSMLLDIVEHKEDGTLLIEGDKKDANFDTIVFYQPSYVRNKKNDSLLHNAVSVISNIRYAKNCGNQLMNFHPPIGAVSLSPAPMMLSVDNEIIQKIPENTYTYQQGDIYLLAKRESDGSLHGDLSSFAANIRVHSVFDLNGKPMIVSNKTAPKLDEVVLI